MAAETAADATGFGIIGPVIGSDSAIFSESVQEVSVPLNPTIDEKHLKNPKICFTSPVWRIYCVVFIFAHSGEPGRHRAL